MHTFTYGNVEKCEKYIKNKIVMALRKNCDDILWKNLLTEEFKNFQ